MKHKSYPKTSPYISVLFFFLFLFLVAYFYSCSSSGGGSDPLENPPADSDNKDPVAKFSPSQTMGIIQTEILFNASASSDPDGSIISYTWDFGDGNTGEEINTAHSYEADGTYTVTLTVTDDDGQSTSYKLSIVISSSGTLVDETGGSIASDDGNLTLTIPQGALSGSLGISIVKTPQVPSGSMADTSYLIQPISIVLDHPVTISIHYDPLDLPNSPEFNEEDLWLGRIAGDGPLNWVPVPGSIVDTNTHTISASLTDFNNLGIISGNIFSQIFSTVYLVDSVEQGQIDQFIELYDALDYLNTNLNNWESGKIIIQTNNTQEISQLILEKNIIIEMDENYTGIINGPGSQPLLISASGALGLTGLPIVNSGGISIQAASDLIISNASFPATAVTVGSSPTKDTNEAGVAGNLWSFTDSTFLGPFKFNALSTLRGQLSLKNLNAPSLDIKNNNYASVKALVSQNIVNDLNISFMLGTEALVNIENHSNLDNMNLDFDLLDETNMNIRLNTTVSAILNFKGQGLALINARLNNYGTSTWDIATNGTTIINSEEEVLGKEGQATIYNVLEGTLMLNHSSFTAEGSVQYVVEDTATMTLKMLSKATYQGDFKFTLHGNLNLELSDTTNINGFAEFIASGSFLNIKTMGASLKSRLQINAENVIVSADVQLGGGVESIIDGLVDFNPPGLGSCNFKADNVQFMLGLQISHDLLSGGKSLLTKNTKATESLFLISNVSVNAINGGILFKDIDQGSITIEESEINGLGGIGFFNVSAPVTLSKNTMTGNGIIVAQSNTTLNISENSITATGTGMGIWANESGDITLNNNTLIDGSGGTCAIYAIGNQRIIASANKTISGRIIAAGNAVIGLTENTFSNASIEDGNQNGGFINDPVNEGNSGMSPNDIKSLVDWDGNDCADYPPENNVKDSEGNCEVVGVSPAS